MQRHSKIGFLIILLILTNAMSVMSLSMRPPEPAFTVECTEWKEPNQFCVNSDCTELLKSQENQVLFTQSGQEDIIIGENRPGNEIIKGSLVVLLQERLKQARLVPLSRVEKFYAQETDSKEIPSATFSQIAQGIEYFCGSPVKTLADQIGSWEDVDWLNNKYILASEHNKEYMTQKNQDPDFCWSYEYNQKGEWLEYGGNWKTKSYCESLYPVGARKVYFPFIWHLVSNPSKITSSHIIWFLPLLIGALALLHGKKIAQWTKKQRFFASDKIVIFWITLEITLIIAAIMYDIIIHYQRTLELMLWIGAWISFPAFLIGTLSQMREILIFVSPMQLILPYLLSFMLGKISPSLMAQKQGKKASIIFFAVQSLITIAVLWVAYGALRVLD